MFKKLFLVIVASVFLMTACDSVKGVNLNQMVLNNSKIKSSQSYAVVSLDLSYKTSNVQDKEYLKVLNLLDNMEFQVQTKMQSADTFSMGGFIQLKQGKIPFQLYSDKKQMVLLLDQASKAIRIPVEQDGGSTEKLVQDIQSKLLPSVVKDLPNPKHINIQTNVNYKVHGEKIKGHKIHAEVYANEVPSLLLKFLDNLSKDQKALTQLATTINEMNKMSGDDTVVSVAELKQVIKEFRVEFNQSLPEMKKSGLFDKRNYLKTDILVDKNFVERKSYTEIRLNKLPEESGGLDGITLKVTQEVWNINKKVTAQKINRTKFLSENASEDEFLSTLDKKHSVLYRVIKSVAPSIPTVNTVYDNATVISGEVESDSKVYAMIGSKKIGEATAKNGRYTMKIKKQKAGTSIVVYAVDLAGNKSASKKVKVIDKTPPSVPTVNKITSKSVTVSGKGENVATIYIYNGSKKIGQATVDSRGNYKVKIKAQKKDSTLKVYAQDKSGNKSKSKAIKVS
jgi:hypothetical protein